MERTFFFLKPDAVIRNHVGAKILDEILTLGCEPKTFLTLSPSRHFLSNEHYYMHKGKPFFDWLLDFVTSANLIVLVLEGKDIIKKVRETLGPTMVEKAVFEDNSSLRARYGLFRGVNLAHASDSSLSASSELLTWTFHFSLRDDAQTREKLERYISIHLDSKYVDTLQYRSLAEELEEHPDRFEEIKKDFVNLLRKENNKLENRKLEDFAEVVLAAI